jgi:hypothetical protein
MRRQLIPLLAALASAACHTMKPVSLDQLNVLRPERAWVTESDRSVVLFDDPKVVGDTLVGYVGRHRTKLPSDALKQLRVRTPAPVRTTLLAVGTAAALAGFLVAIAGNGQTQFTTPIAGAPGDCDKHPEQPECT